MFPIGSDGCVRYADSDKGLVKDRFSDIKNA